MPDANAVGKWLCCRLSYVMIIAHYHTLRKTNASFLLGLKSGFRAAVEVLQHYYVLMLLSAALSTTYPRRFLTQVHACLLLFKYVTRLAALHIYTRWHGLNILNAPDVSLKPSMDRSLLSFCWFQHPRLYMFVRSSNALMFYFFNDVLMPQFNMIS